jgi:hypothetical protein
MNLPASSYGVSPEKSSYPPHPALSPEGARESSNPAASCRESFGWSMEKSLQIKRHRQKLNEKLIRRLSKDKPLQVIIREM